MIYIKPVSYWLRLQYAGFSDYDKVPGGKRMKYRRCLILLFLLFISLASPLHAITDEQYRTVENIGKLNGIALQCGFYDQTRIMKKALVNALPKRRQLGQAFETVTNESFMAFMEANSSCPDEADFSKEVDESIRLLNQAFGAE